MALENQPLFQAPSLPKMGKGSSPLMSGAKTIGFSFAKPKLKASKMSFVRAKKAKAIKAEDLKGPETVSTGSLATTLTETNRILVEIQNQLAIDFANRIAEKKQTLKLSRKTVRKKKLGEKEQFVERGVKLQKSANTFGEKVLAPIKSIFDRLIDFLTIVGGGIVLNAAWEWLQDEKNRENLIKVFTFLKTYWKEILIGLLTVKVLGAIGKLVGFANTLRKIFNRLKGLGRKPPQPPSSGGTKPGSGGPSGGCGPITGKGGCLDQLSTTSQVANNLARKLLVTGAASSYFKRFITRNDLAKILEERGLVESGGTETTAEDPALSADKGTSFDPKEASKTLEDLFGVSLAPYATNQIMVPGPGGIVGRNSMADSISIPGYDPKDRDVYAKRIADYISNNPNSELAKILVRGAIINGDAEKNGRIYLTKNGVEFFEPLEKNIAFYAAQILGVTQSVFDAFPTGLPRSARGSGITRRPITKIRPNLFQRPRTGTVGRETRLKLPAGIDIDTLSPSVRKYLEKNFTDMDTTTQDFLLEQFKRDPALLKDLDRIQEEVMGPTVPRENPESQFNEPAQSKSKGGTIFGKGSQTVDSVPAMLAPGEEVIRSSSSNLFRPVLKDINDNAGRMFTAFRDGVNLMKGNNDLQAQETNRSLTLFEKFKELLDGQVQKREREKTREVLNSMMLVSNNTTAQRNPTQNLLNVSSNQSQPQNQFLKVSLTPPNENLNRYNHRRRTTTTGGEGVQTVVASLPGTVVDARTPVQAQPEEQPRDSSSTDIIILPMDSDNPFFGRSSSAYGVVL